MSASTPASRVYAGQTADDRRAARREALLDAALELVAQTGSDGFSIGTLCASARLNTRYFYESFASTDELVGALVERVAGEAVAASLSALPEDGDLTPDDARAAVAAFVEHLTDDPRRGRVLFGAVPAGDVVALGRDQALARFMAITVAHGREIFKLGEDSRIDLATAVMVAGSGRAILDWIDGRLDCTRELLVEELVAIWLGIAQITTARVLAGQ